MLVGATVFNKMVNVDGIRDLTHLYPTPHFGVWLSKMSGCILLSHTPLRYGVLLSKMVWLSSMLGYCLVICRLIYVRGIAQ